MRADPVWAIIPALNVENSIGEVIDQTKEYIPRVIIVNNGAIDSIELTTCHFQTERWPSCGPLRVERPGGRKP